MCLSLCLYWLQSKRIRICVRLSSPYFPSTLLCFMVDCCQLIMYRKNVRQLLEPIPTHMQLSLCATNIQPINNPQIELKTNFSQILCYFYYPWKRREAEREIDRERAHDEIAWEYDDWVTKEKKQNIKSYVCSTGIDINVSAIFMNLNT